MRYSLDSVDATPSDIQQMEKFQSESYVGLYERSDSVRVYVFRFWKNYSPCCPDCGSIIGSSGQLTAYSVKAHDNNCKAFGKGKKKDLSNCVHLNLIE